MKTAEQWDEESHEELAALRGAARDFMIEVESIGIGEIENTFPDIAVAYRDTCKAMGLKPIKAA